MKQYIDTFKALLRLNVSRYLAYRANFVNSLFSSLIWSIFSFLYIILLTSKTPVVYGWTRNQLILLMGLYNIVIGGFFHGFFSRNFDRFSEKIHMGKLDAILLKPIDSQFSMSFELVAYTQFARLFVGLGVSVYIIQADHIKVTMAGLLGFCLLSVFGITLLYSIWYIVMTFTVWYTKLSNLTDLLYHLNDISRFPPKMFSGLKAFGLFLIPYTLLLITPTKTLIQHITFLDAIELIILSVSFLILSRKFWRFALKSYTSASV